MSTSTAFAAFELIKKPLTELQEVLAEYCAEVKVTKYPQTCIIKFNPSTTASHPTINQLRGLIYNVETAEIYSLGYPVPAEFKDYSPTVQGNIVRSIKAAGYTIHEALDGTLLRLWYHPLVKQWILSTNGVEDANDAYWMNGVSFGTLFNTTLTGILSNLKTDYVYLFSLCHPLNVIVVNHEKPQIYHVATYDRTTLQEVECDLGVQKAPQLEMTVEDAIKSTQESISKPVLSAGFVIKQKPDADGVVYRFRVENANYTKARRLRGDTNEINLTIIGHLIKQDLDEFLLYYPIYKQLAQQLQECINRLVTILTDEYTLRFKKHLKIFVHPLHHTFLFELHQIYLTQLRQSGQTVQGADIKKYLLSQSVIRINQLLN
jgi:hypothetical protein